ncbi:pisatin demethylase [Penicillium sp. IBT 35674x]|nr:pisatin demethylase [Penicillium sp. IBT 35674x]
MDQFRSNITFPPSFVLTLSPFLIYLLYTQIFTALLRPDLRQIPGPILAKFTNLYRLALVNTGSAHIYHQALHKRHGPFIRLGPNTISIGTPAAIPILYNTRTRYPKSAFYPVMGNVAHGKVIPTIFSTQDEAVHEMMKRPIAQVYGMTNLQTYEALVESTEGLFVKKLEMLADEQKVFDLGTWMHWFATDVIMEITFGERFGFLERGKTWIISWCQQNVQAGSDSTAITLTSVFYHLLKDPDSMKTLLAELEQCTSFIPGIPLERVVPAGGIEVCGKYFRGGTVLGVNAWVAHRDEEVYGVDADDWRPGRWIDAGQEKRKEMERLLFAFGGGSRVCLGRNISYLEMYKVIPEVLTQFKVWNRSLGVNILEIVLLVRH